MQTDITEQELLRRCLGGEQQAQFVLYKRYATAMYNTAMRMLADVREAEDVLQESFTRVFQRLHTFRGESTIGAWIKRIVVNTTLNRIKDRQKLQFESLEPWHESLEEPAGFDGNWDAATLHEAIKKLPEGCRIIFNLYAVEEMSHKAIAELLNVSESTSKTQYLRARRMLKTQLLAMPTNQ